MKKKTQAQKSRHKTRQRSITRRRETIRDEPRTHHKSPLTLVVSVDSLPLISRSELRETAREKPEEYTPFASVAGGRPSFDNASICSAR